MRVPSFFWAAAPPHASTRPGLPNDQLKAAKLLPRGPMTPAPKRSPKPQRTTSASGCNRRNMSSPGGERGSHSPQAAAGQKGTGQEPP